MFFVCLEEFFSYAYTYTLKNNIIQTESNIIIKEIPYGRFFT